jgi:hypothetical protein
VPFWVAHVCKSVYGTRWVEIRTIEMIPMLFGSKDNFCLDVLVKDAFVNVHYDSLGLNIFVFADTN